jgi:hypothetical protein
MIIFLLALNAFADTPLTVNGFAITAITRGNQIVVQAAKNASATNEFKFTGMDSASQLKAVRLNKTKCSNRYFILHYQELKPFKQTEQGCHSAAVLSLDNQGGIAAIQRLEHTCDFGGEGENKEKNSFARRYAIVDKAGQPTLTTAAEDIAKFKRCDEIK